jgi:excisionase family DNA binding protein
MDEGALLTLEEAASRSGYRKRELRALVREGRLPAVRSGKRWQVATADLAMLPSRIVSPPEAPEPEAQPTVEAPSEKSTDPVIALIELLRERDRKLAELLEERSQLTGQVGFLLGQLSEREERIQWLERTTLTQATGPSVSVLPSVPAPVALIDQWAKPASPDPVISGAESIADSPTDPKSNPSALGGAVNSEAEPAHTVPTAVPDPVTAAAAPYAEIVEAPSVMPVPPRRRLFGLFRRRMPG